MSQSIPPVQPDGQGLEYAAPVSASQHVSAQKPVKQARDKAQYVRQQRGHSLIVQFCLVGVFTLWIVPLYYAFSPNHYYHI